MILRTEKEVPPCSINDNGGSSRTLQTCEIQMAYAEWRDTAGEESTADHRTQEGGVLSCVTPEA